MTRGRKMESLSPKFHSFILSNGVRMPKLGLGMSHKGGYSHSAFIYALKECDYRLIDTAVRYNNEDEIGLVVKESGVPREELFLTTKLWPAQYGYESTIIDFQKSCKRLGVDYIDLYLMHWPDCPNACKDKRQLRADTWRAMETLYKQGLCRAIGVSNFLIHHLDEFLQDCTIVPHVNQVEYHPYHNPKELVAYCRDRGIQFEGYSPLAKRTLLDKAPIQEIAKRNNCTEAQVLLRWSIQNDVVAIPKSTSEKRLKENAQVFGIELSKADMNILDNLHTGYRIVDASLIQDKVNLSYEQLRLLLQRDDSCKQKKKMHKIVESFQI